MGHDLSDGRAVISTADPRLFILNETRFFAPTLVPEVGLHLADDSLELWQKTIDELEEIGLPLPFWAFAWAGGQALARYILDHPETVRGKNVLDFASGSGIVGIAAMKAGAASVLACDIDPFAMVAIHLNAEANGVAVSIHADDVIAQPLTAHDVLLAGDVFYEKPMADLVLPFLKAHAQRGAEVLVGDPGRTYLPKDNLTELAHYNVLTPRTIEDAQIKRTKVWGLYQAHELP